MSKHKRDVSPKRDAKRDAKCDAKRKEPCFHNIAKSSCKLCSPHIVCKHFEFIRICVECRPTTAIDIPVPKKVKPPKPMKKAKLPKVPEVSEVPKPVKSSRLRKLRHPCGKHGYYRNFCKRCNPKLACSHSANRYLCSKCSDKELTRVRQKCKHDKYSGDCVRCSPHLACRHKLVKRRCKKCRKEQDT